MQLLQISLVLCILYEVYKLFFTNSFIKLSEDATEFSELLGKSTSRESTVPDAISKFGKTRSAIISFYKLFGAFYWLLIISGFIFSIYYSKTEPYKALSLEFFAIIIMGLINIKFDLDNGANKKAITLDAICSLTILSIMLYQTIFVK